MTNGRSGQTSEGSRTVNLEGDSPELVAFALLRNVVQVEQAHANQTGVVFDRDWLLDAYADCLEAVRGGRVKAAAHTAPKADKSRAAKR
ncbi:hypothetical protein AB4072_13850 [Microvirga sp. 2MCAF38]|uniref:hypothetical protein n=1 Tax=Microvirga sp. 2MCAF38 TaxID=3232989 RepID=UPI003F9AF195